MPDDLTNKKDEAPSRRQSGAAIGTVRVDIARQEKKTFEAVFKTEEKSFQLMIDDLKFEAARVWDRRRSVIS